MKDFFQIDGYIKEKADKALYMAAKSFQRIDEITEHNQQKVLSAFIKNGVSESHFTGTTGYGYGDRGRDNLDKVFACTFSAEDALVRHSFTCGTHAIAVALFALLRSGDTLLSVTGRPYDTLHSTLGFNNAKGSLKEFGVKYEEIPLLADGGVDYESLQRILKEKKVKIVYIQRSRGYTVRPSLFVSEIKKITGIAKALQPECITVVDNCYGEFAEKTEPVSAGADLMMGSLIKNPGGGMARTGGYIAGRADLIEECSYRMTVPGIGREVGATLGMNRELYMGLFNAPHVTGEALKTAIFTAALFKELGYDVSPGTGDERTDIIQSVMLHNQESLVAFCQGLQKGAPVDSFVVPEPWDMPGYDSKVIMSAGAFTLGASIELSADAPLREPFAVWLQGGLNFHSAKTGVMLAANELKLRNLLI